MSFTLYKPDIFKVYTTIEKTEVVFWRNDLTFKHSVPTQVVKYFYPGPDLIELGPLAKGYNAFTEACDKFRRSDYVPKDPEYEKLTRTYLYMGGAINIVEKPLSKDKYGDRTVGCVIVRSPGATRGSLVIDINTRKIIDIIFNPDTCFSCMYGCYERSIMKLVDEFKNTPYEVDRIDDFSMVGEAL